MLRARLPLPLSDRIELHLYVDEAEAELAVLDKKLAKQTVADADWNQLLAAEPYVRLKKREAELDRDFTDDDFKKFVLSPELSAKASQFRRTLADWKKADLMVAARRVLAYLPDQSHIRTKVFPVIKPQTNSYGRFRQSCILKSSLTRVGLHFLLRIWPSTRLV